MSDEIVEEIEQAVESIVSVKPSKLAWVLIGIGGLAAGICVGWYLAGGMKIEEEFYAAVDEVAEEVEEQIGKHAADESTGLEE
jgi:hypothetical protein